MAFAYLVARTNTITPLAVCTIEVLVALFGHFFSDFFGYFDLISSKI